MLFFFMLFFIVFYWVNCFIFFTQSLKTTLSVFENIYIYMRVCVWDITIRHHNIFFHI